MNLKRFAIFSFCLFLGLGAFVFFFNKEAPKTTHQPPQSPKDWMTFEKQKKEITKHPSTKRELKAINKEKKEKEERKPAAKPINDHRVKRFGRVLLGPDSPQYKDLKKELIISNKVNPNWQESLGNELLRFQEESTKVIVKDLGSFIQTRGGKGLFVNKVYISYLLDNGARSSFNALVNSETGKMIHTWNKTRQMKQIFQRKRPFKGSPLISN